VTVFEIISKYKTGFLDGIQITLCLCLIIWSAGLVIGSLLGVLSQRYKISIGIPTRIVSFLLSGVPVLVFLFWLHYPFQKMIGRNIDPFITTAITISLINIFAVAEIVRNSIQDLPSQFIEAAKVCGIKSKKQLWQIEFPIIFRYVLPSFLIAQVNMLHLTLFGSLISVNEIFRVSQQINSQIYQPVEIFTALGIFFLIVCLPINGLAMYLKMKFARNISER
jgi:His/Glu/Gln/Arg/opine family amino acid ABC transporter permease subunit